MSGQSDNIYKIQNSDIEKAGAVLADSFEHDPIWEKVLKGCSPVQRRTWFQSPVRYCMKYGAAIATSHAIEGFAGWLPGEYSEMTFGRILKSGVYHTGNKAGFKPMLRMMPLRVFDADRKKHMQDRPYIYVMIIGVAPEYQGQGFGGKLLRNIINESDNTGLPIYLETSTHGNVAMYNHLGFKTLDEINLPKLNLPQWEMLREPAGNFVQGEV